VLLTPFGDEEAMPLLVRNPHKVATLRLLAFHVYVSGEKPSVKYMIYPIELLVMTAYN
jgi:hypothetical protein